jgi:hypothetical protein
MGKGVREMKRYAPDKFLSELSENALPSGEKGITLGGLVKVSEGSSSTIEFSSSLSCQKWTSLPLALVESIDHVRMVTCKDHEHPLVVVRLKSSEKAGEDVAFLMSMVSELQGVIANSHTSARQRKLAGDDRDGCVIVSTEDDLLLCCWDGNEFFDCAPVLKLLKPD